MKNDLFESLLISKIITDLPIWVLDSEWERAFLLAILWVLVTIILIGTKKEPSGRNTKAQ